MTTLPAKPETIEQAPLEARVTEMLIDLYLKGFQGAPLVELAAAVDAEMTEMLELLEQMVGARRAQVRSEEADPNPAILRLPEASAETQLGWLRGPPGSAWIFPGPAALGGRPELAGHVGRPYTARLAAGEAQLAPAFFDLQVLDRYKRDPRYRVVLLGYSGHLDIRDQAFGDPAFPARDKVALQSYGIGYRPDGTRVLTVFLCYLSELTPEHQALWKSYEVMETCKVASDYVDNAAFGRLTGTRSLYAALLTEMEVINAIASAMGRGRLFRRADPREPPDGLHTLLRPTRREYLEFVVVLFKLLVDNLDIGFFGTDVERRDAEGRDKASLQMLEEWLRTQFEPATGAHPAPLVMEPLHSVRKERLEPAHKLTPDEHDIAYYDRHDDLLKAVYRSVHTLRLILANHPAAAGVPIPDWLDRGDISLY